MATQPQAPNPGPARALFDAEPAAFSAILSHYMGVFTYDAGQRLSTFQYFLTAFAFLTAAFTATADVKLDSTRLPLLVPPMISAAAFLLAVLFARLDKRNTQLVKLDQLPLTALQAAIASRLGEDAGWHSFREASDKARKLTTYGTLIPLVYFLAALIAVGGGWVTAAGAKAVTPTQAIVGALACAVAAWFAVHLDLPLKTPDQAAKR